MWIATESAKKSFLFSLLWVCVCVLCGGALARENEAKIHKSTSRNNKWENENAPDAVDRMMNGKILLERT